MIPTLKVETDDEMNKESISSSKKVKDNDNN